MIVNQKKSHKAYRIFKSQKNHTLQFGNFGLQNLQDVRLASNQIQNFYLILKKSLKSSKNRNSTKIWTRLNLNLNLTKLSLESRMGKGKGNITSTAQFLKTGTVFFEFSYLDDHTSLKLFKRLNSIFPAKIKVIKRYT